MASNKWHWDTANNREAEAGNTAGGDSVTSPNHNADGELDFLATAKQAVMQSENFITSSLRRRWSKSYKSFQSQHSDASKYLSKRFRGRSSLFRPKTRMVVRKADAQVGAAFFATHDVVQMTAENDGDELQLAGSKLQHEIMNLRLDRANTDHGIPWFLIVIGANQDAKITGICCTKQSWLYEEEVEKREVEVIDELTGETFIEEEEVPVRKVSRPEIDLFPPEMVLRDPAAHWLDQAQRSSYVVLKIPMSVGDVKARMKKEGEVHGGDWHQLDDSQIRRSLVNLDNAAVRQSREGKSTDRMDNTYTTVRDFEVVWVHENFVRIGGKDWHYWTLGVYEMLSDPIPVQEAYPEQKGRRPIVIGYGQVEAHKTDPQSAVESWQPLQQEINDVVNLRLDNVKMSISPVTKIRRGRNVDVSQVQNRSADSVIWVNDPADVEWDKVPDVSSSAYAEMDRLNVDFDDLAGTFSTGSVQSNRQLNETVGGMQMMNQSANSLGEFDIRVLNETWMEPTLRQLANLTAYYEDDPQILQIAGAKAGLWDQYVEQLHGQHINELLMVNVQLRVDAGMGASDPMQRLQKMRLGAETLQVMLGPERVMAMANAESIVSEVWGVLGYKDGDRFYDTEKDQDPMMMQAQQQLQMCAAEIEKLTKELEEGEADRQNDVLLQRMKSATDLIKELIRDETQQEQALLTSQGAVLGIKQRDSQARMSDRQTTMGRISSDRNTENARQDRKDEMKRKPALV